MDGRAYTFTLLVDGPDLQDGKQLDALFEAGCDDATFGSRDGTRFADFDREAGSLAEAIRSAIQDVTSAVPDARIRRVEPEEFVSLKAIADRMGFTKQYVQMLAVGKRGPGGFPAPRRFVDSKTRLWLWSDVAEWFATRLGKDVAEVSEAHTIAAFNGLLEIRHHVSLGEDDVRDEVLEFIREDDELRVLLAR